MPTEDTDAVPPFNRQEHESERKAVFDAIDRFLTRYYGCRCPEQSGGCQPCIVWAARDMLSAALWE